MCPDPFGQPSLFYYCFEKDITLPSARNRLLETEIFP